MVWTPPFLFLSCVHDYIYVITIYGSNRTYLHVLINYKIAYTYTHHLFVMFPSCFTTMFLHTRISRCTDASMFLPWNSYDTAEGSGVGLVVCSKATLGFNRIKHLSNGITGSIIKAPCGKTAGNTVFFNWCPQAHPVHV